MRNLGYAASNPQGPLKRESSNEISVQAGSLWLQHGRWTDTAKSDMK